MSYIIKVTLEESNGKNELEWKAKRVDIEERSHARQLYEILRVLMELVSVLLRKAGFKEEAKSGD